MYYYYYCYYYYHQSPYRMHTTELREEHAFLHPRREPRRHRRPQRRLDDVALLGRDIYIYIYIYTHTYIHIYIYIHTYYIHRAQNTQAPHHSALPLVSSSHAETCIAAHHLTIMTSFRRHTTPSLNERPNNLCK